MIDGNAEHRGRDIPPAGLLAWVWQSKAAQNLVIVLSSLTLLAAFVYLARTDWFVDSSIYHRAGIAVREHSNLYARILEMRDNGWTIDGPNGIPANRGEPRIFPDFPYIYAPAFAIAYVPLSYLPLHAANLAWLAIGFACLIGSLYLITGWFQPAPHRRRLAIALAASVLSVALQPVRNSLYIGNADCLLLLLVVLSLTAFTKARQGRAGVWLALATVIKPPLGLIVVLYAWKRGYRDAVVCAALAGVILLAPFLFMGLDALRDFLHALSYWTSPLPASGTVNQAPYGLLLRLFTVNDFTVPLIDAPVLAQVGRWVVFGGVLLVLALTVRRGRAHSMRRSALEYGAVVTAILLMSPHTEPIHLTLLVIPLAAVVAAIALGWCWTREQMITGVALIALIGYLILPVAARTGFILNGDGVAVLSYPKALLLNTDLFALCTTAGLVLVVLLQQRKSEEPLNDHRANISTSRYAGEPVSISG